MCKYPFKWKFIFSLPFLCILYSFFCSFHFHFLLSLESEQGRQGDGVNKKNSWPILVFSSQRESERISGARVKHTILHFARAFQMHNVTYRGWNSVESASVWKAVKWKHGITLYECMYVFYYVFLQEKHWMRNHTEQERSTRLETRTPHIHAAFICLYAIKKKYIHNFEERKVVNFPYLMCILQSSLFRVFSSCFTIPLLFIAILFFFSLSPFIVINVDATMPLPPPSTFVRVKM